MFHRLYLSLIFALLFTGAFIRANDTIYSSPEYTITASGVSQDTFQARAVSPTHITSNYHSTYKQPTKRLIDFKFSINGRDNERHPGEDHHLLLPADKKAVTTPAYVFGENDKNAPETIPGGQSPYLSTDVALTIRLDMRHVFKAMKEDGYFVTYTQDTIYADKFRGVYIAGSTQPLTWSFANLPARDDLNLKDADGDGIFTVTLEFEKYQGAEETQPGTREWQLTKDISHLPKYSGPLPLTEGLYNMSLEEMLLDIREDGALMAGAKWPGVWTRDISYSILLSLAMIQPEAAKMSLMAKVKDDEIIQDTGTGGSWPVSSDRMTWALAAWEIYKATGDQDWLAKSYRIIRNSAENDLRALQDPRTGLFRGESSFLDWREQTYPRWMDPRDIYMSLNLGTNAVHYQTYSILAAMGKLLDESSAEKYTAIADRIKSGINAHLWDDETGYYGQYLYGRNYMSLSPKSETLGEALTILFDIAPNDRKEMIVRNLPVEAFGSPCIYPHIPDIPPYHNNGIWPFVVSYWTWASAKADAVKSVELGFASMYRAAALFLTNKENMVAASGDYMGTEINSDRQLWSVAGNLATFYRVIFGMSLTENALGFDPLIPQPYAGTHHLEDFPYRKSTLDITVKGYGDGIVSFQLDGKARETFTIPGDLSGNHRIEIVMNNAFSNTEDPNIVANHTAPPAPTVRSEKGDLSWDAVDSATQYQIYRNGKKIAETNSFSYNVPSQRDGEYQVLSVSSAGLESFLSEPISFYSREDIIAVEAENGVRAETQYSGYRGDGYVTLSKNKHANLDIPVIIGQSGTYSLDFRYANGNGPINTDNKCAIRTVFVDGEEAGKLVLPQRGTDNWNDWGYSNPLRLELSAGDHMVKIKYTQYDENMNRTVNAAAVDQLRLMRLGIVN